MPGQASSTAITWGTLVFLGGLLTTVIGGVVFISAEIADAKAEAVRDAKRMIIEEKARADRDYATTKDVAVIGAKLDALVSTQRTLILKLDESPRSRRGR